MRSQVTSDQKPNTVRRRSTNLLSSHTKPRTLMCLAARTYCKPPDRPEKRHVVHCDSRGKCVPQELFDCKGGIAGANRTSRLLLLYEQQRKMSCIYPPQQLKCRYAVIRHRSCDPGTSDITVDRLWCASCRIGGIAQALGGIPRASKTDQGVCSGNPPSPVSEFAHGAIEVL